MTRYAVQLDPGEPSFLRDPYQVLSALRANGPVLWHEPMGMWLATTHKSVSQVLRSRSFGRIWSDWQPTSHLEPFNALHRNQMMDCEVRDHSRLRGLVAKSFSRGHVERMQPRIAELATTMVDALGDRFDVLGDYAEPMPVYVICDLLGIPREDHKQLRSWSQAIVRMYEPNVGLLVKRDAVTASIAFSDYVHGIIDQRRADPGEDLITGLLRERDRGAQLTDDELVASVVLLLNAGHEASVNAFGNGVHALLSHPDQLSRITSGEVSMDNAVEELIRYDAPLQLFERTATADVKVSGQLVAAGQKIACLMGSANRDDVAFAVEGQPDAATFDVGRDPNPHVGFGMGRHFCLGAPLARLELQISLGALLARFPRLALVGDAPRRPTWVLRGFERIEVECT